MTVVWLWLRAHRWPSLVAACGVMALVGAVFGEELVPVPSLAAARRLSVPLAQLLPLVVACAVGLHSRTPTSLFRVVPRSAMAQRLALVCTLLATATVTCLLIPSGSIALRNTFGLSGIALIAATVAGATRSWTLPLCHLMGCLLFGTRARSAADGVTGTQWWAFAVAPESDRVAAILAIGCCLVGAAVFIVRGPQEESVVDHGG
ncbi:hypothetical protein [Saccharothrix australiensis]|uniref:Uncharacterized protein n=1 Tax=Saccharothrix australiensis TaxID=2072 RepID=A0A495VYJ2_9PSEU|nr:hypothetical protein [Saccharothrix australiensis]RKT53653.1 hypothetical protein C8E97_2227 [Saccharothrix australiensis]